MRTHANYERLGELALDSHRRGRAVSGIGQCDVSLARLYSYAFRLHVIGAFHATQVALEAVAVPDELAKLQLRRAAESLNDLANRSMEAVSEDERTLISTFHHYYTHLGRAVEAIDAACERAALDELFKIRTRFLESMEAITTSNGIHVTVDTHAPTQASYLVPSLGITIVPLVYGDHHSWNLAWLDGDCSDVPYHLHHEGVEIHLGYSPLHGYTVLGDSKAEVTESYAMPIPPMTRHGYTNIGPQTHHVPFIFGSQSCSGWGVFLDVEPQPVPLDQLVSRSLLSPALNGSVYLDREIDAAAAKHHPVRYPIISAAMTDRADVGGLELSVSRITSRPFRLTSDRFCAMSVVRGCGVVRMSGQERAVAKHDHFGIPANLPAELQASGSEPFVLLDAVLKPAPRGN